MSVDGAQRFVLKKVQEMQGFGGEFVEDRRIAEATDMSLGDVQNWLVTLQNAGLISLVRTNAGYVAFLEARGRIELNQTAQVIGVPPVTPRNRLEIDVGKLKHLRFYLSEVFFRTQEIRSKVGEPPRPYPGLLCIEDVQEVSRGGNEWFNGPGSYLISSCYLAACLFWCCREVKEEVLSREVDEETQRGLMDLLLKVSLAFLRDMGVFYVTQDAIGQLLYIDEKGRLMTYFEFCDLLRNPEKRAWLDRLMNFYLLTGKGQHLERITEVLGSILELSDYLDVLSGMGTSVRDRLRAEGLHNIATIR